MSAQVVIAIVRNRAIRYVDLLPAEGDVKLFSFL